METDKINEGWLFKSKEDKLTLNILKRIKERWPSDTILYDYRRLINRNKEITDLPKWGENIRFTLPGIEREARIEVVCFNYRVGGGTGCRLTVNDRDLEASKWAIKKLYNYMFEKIYDEAKVQYDRAIQSDLTDPSYAEDVFDMLDDEDTVNEGKESFRNKIDAARKMLEAGFSNKDVEKIYGVEAVNQANFEMEDPYHDPNSFVNEGKKKKEKKARSIRKNGNVVLKT